MRIYRESRDASMDTVSKINRAHQQLDAHQVREELASLQSSLAVVSSSVNQLSKQISNLKGSILSATQVINTCRQLPEQPPSYANVFSANIVKTAVLQVMQEQKQAASDKASIVVYGFQGKGHVQIQLQELLEFIWLLGYYHQLVQD